MDEENLKGDEAFLRCFYNFLHKRRMLRVDGWLYLSWARYNPRMVRLRSTVRCKGCGDAPDLRDGQFVCQCPKFQWTPQRGCEGTAEDRELLVRYGWKMFTDPSGIVFWIAPGNTGVVHLYADGTWCGGPVEIRTLDEFLEWHANGRQWSQLIKSAKAETRLK